MFETPVLLIIYNRITETHNIFQTIHAIKPSKLYVAADGAKQEDPNDYGTCLRTRSVIMPEWPCQLKLMFKDEHLGKAQMVFQAINWFFENEPEGIILFDDTMPHPDFFPYCEQLLDKYRDNKQIVHIGGSNFQHERQRGDASYYFSCYATTWGFATWKDRWENFDLSMANLKDFNFPEILTHYMKKREERNYWLRRGIALQRYHFDDIWEFQYKFHLWSKQGLCISPNVNLVTNVGFKKNKRKIRKMSLPAHAIMPLTHPEEIEQNRKADRFAFRRYFNKALRVLFAKWFTETLLGSKDKDQTAQSNDK